MDTITEFSQALRAARKARGLSQRALAKLAGVPQSHISKIENAGVDLRISSLTEIARALGLELALVPRKAVPAVNSIIRGAQPEATQVTADNLAKELSKLDSAADNIARRQGGLNKEAAQLRSRVHDVTRFEIPDSYLATLEKLNKQLKELDREPGNLERLLSSLDDVQALRNSLAHSLPEPAPQTRRSAYSLEDDDG